MIEINSQCNAVEYDERCSNTVTDVHGMALDFCLYHQDQIKAGEKVWCRACEKTITK